MIGAALKFLINSWLLTTGKVVSFKDHPWLEGPMSDSAVVGDRFYSMYAEKTGLSCVRTVDGGLIDDFNKVISHEASSGNQLNARIRHFYEHTAQYKLEVWSQWYGPVSFFSRILIRSVSSKMDQLNIPLEPLETSRGMTNEVLQLKDIHTNELKLTCWLRKSILSRRVVYAGFYSGCIANGKPYVRVVFPLPDGSATVLLKVVVQSDGSVKLLSDGNKLGNAGYYRLRRYKADGVKVKHIPLKESIHVFEDEENVLRTDHQFSFWGMKFLHLHYKIIPLR